MTVVKSTNTDIQKLVFSKLGETFNYRKTTWKFKNYEVIDGKYNCYIEHSKIPIVNTIYLSPEQTIMLLNSELPRQVNDFSYA